VDEHFKGKESEEDKGKYNYRISDRHLCKVVSNKGTTAVFDNELVGAIVENDKVEFDIMQDMADGKGIGMFPIGSVSIALMGLQDLWLDPINVEEFMGSRFGYNSRIKSNQSVFVNFMLSE